MNKKRINNKISFAVRPRGGRFACVFILLAAAVLFSGCGIKKRIKKADKRFEVGEYYTAGDIYKSSYSRISAKKDRPLKAHVAFRQGESYRLTNHSMTASAYQ